MGGGSGIKHNQSEPVTYLSLALVFVWAAKVTILISVE